MLERRLFCVRWWVLTAAIITMQQLLFFPREGLTCTRVYVGIGASRAAWAKYVSSLWVGEYKRTV